MGAVDTEELAPFYDALVVSEDDIAFFTARAAFTVSEDRGILPENSRKPNQENAWKGNGTSNPGRVG